jgi:hypothetical protein
MLRRNRTVTAVLLAATTVTLTAGCGSKVVSVTPPTPSPDAAGTCRALVARLPATVGGLARRDTSPESPYTAAWGSPAVTLRCGVPPKPSDSSAAAADVLGVAWRTREVGDLVQWDTDGRAVDVEVRVPLFYTSQENVIADIGAQVTSVVPTSSPTPTAS